MPSNEHGENIQLQGNKPLNISTGFNVKGLFSLEAAFLSYYAC